MPNYTSTVLGTVVVVVGGAQVTRLANQKYNASAPRAARKPVADPMSPVLAGFALGLFLFAAGIASERLASMLCLLIVVTSLLVNGRNLFSLLSALK